MSNIIVKDVEDGEIDPDAKESTSFEKRVREELEAEYKHSPGSFGTNQHLKIPSYFKDYGRRFVLQYPYTEKHNAIINVTDEHNLDKVMKEYLLENELYQQSIIPVKAPPELVLAVAQKSALLEAATPINPSDEVMYRNILRTGDYWNDVVEEKVDPDKLYLRSKRPTKMDPLRVEIQPGSDLYQLVAELKKISPRLLYVINDDE
ncbi:unnamed protein product [Leptosia nina]|uniref:Uncharacterized protein n=1 Tax=Leptosia nina TaxID=320188 RepID=A0AAV1JMC5_9NEOP